MKSEEIGRMQYLERQGKAGLFVVAICGSAFGFGCRSTYPIHPTAIPFPADYRRASHFKPIEPLNTNAVLPLSEMHTFTQVVQASVVEAADDYQFVEPAHSDAALTQSIDLTTALMLTTGQNPQVAFARSRIEESLAQLDRANALKLPSLRAGVNYNKHEGRIQDVAGSVIETSRGSFYSGLGANAVGAGSPAVPGIVSQFHFADAIFQPRIAQRTACARRAGAEATTNDLLLATAIAYTELLRSEQDWVIARGIVERAEKLSETTGMFAKAGEGLDSDHDRLRTEVSLRKSDLIRAEETAKVASSRLAELVRWDAEQRLVPSETQLSPIELVDQTPSARECVAQALTKRPELAESRHWVGEAVERLSSERNAPLIPSVLLSASYGGLGGGLGGSLSNYGDRLDADAVAYWEVRQLGVGENAIRREARSRIAQARSKELSQMDRIAHEVMESHAQVASRLKQIPIIEAAVVTAEESYNKNWDRIQNGQGLPIEVLQSIQALAAAQREYVKVVAEYNVSQFTLHRAMGWPIDSDFSVPSAR